MIYVRVSITFWVSKYMKYLISVLLFVCLFLLISCSDAIIPNTGGISPDIGRMLTSIATEYIVGVPIIIRGIGIR